MGQEKNTRGSENKNWQFFLKVLLQFYKRRRFGKYSDPFYARELQRRKDAENLSARAAAMPRRKVLLAAVDVASRREALDRAVAAFSRTKHDVTFVHAAMGDRGKFDNIALAIQDIPMQDYDWFVVFDDDIELPPNFLDEFLFVSEAFELVLSQPAHIIESHRVWDITRRTWGNLARTTRYVECGPVTAFHRSLLPYILPFPTTRYGWGIDAIWSDVAEKHGMKIGIVDATPLQHTRPVAGSYNWSAADDEMKALLAAHGISNDISDFMVTTGCYRSLPKDSGK